MVTKTEPIHMGDVVETWQKREQGRPVSRWDLDDLWRAACSILSAREAGAMHQVDAAEWHHQQAERFLDQYNAAVGDAAQQEVEG